MEWYYSYLREGLQFAYKFHARYGVPGLERLEISSRLDRYRPGSWGHENIPSCSWGKFISENLVFEACEVINASGGYHAVRILEPNEESFGQHSHTAPIERLLSTVCRPIGLCTSVWRQCSIHNLRDGETWKGQKNGFYKGSLFLKTHSVARGPPTNDDLSLTEWAANKGCLGSDSILPLHPSIFMAIEMSYSSQTSAESHPCSRKMHAFAMYYFCSAHSPLQVASR